MISPPSLRLHSNTYLGDDSGRAEKELRNTVAENQTNGVPGAGIQPAQKRQSGLFLKVVEGLRGARRARGVHGNESDGTRTGEGQHRPNQERGHGQLGGAQGPGKTKYRDHGWQVQPVVPGRPAGRAHP